MFFEVTEKVSWLSTPIENQDSVYCIGFSLVKNDHIFGAFSISAPGLSLRQ